MFFSFHLDADFRRYPQKKIFFKENLGI